MESAPYATLLGNVVRTATIDVGDPYDLNVLDAL
jgi:hypothetical protein